MSFVNIDEQGATTPSRFTGGRIMYDAAGQMAAQLTHADRPALPPAPTEAQRSAVYSGDTERRRPGNRNADLGADSLTTAAYLPSSVKANTLPLAVPDITATYCLPSSS